MSARGVLFLACLGQATVTAQSVQIPQQLEQGVTAYARAMESTERNARIRGFASAAQWFQQALDELPPGQRSPALYVNLGNAALQAEQLGPAIAAFRQALDRQPTHQQAQQNLAFARQQLPPSLQPSVDDGLWDTLFFWRAAYPREQIAVAAALCFLLTAGMLAAGVAWRLVGLRNLACLPAVLWCALWISAGGAGRSAKELEGVVIADEITLRAADSENAPPRLSEAIPSGVEVKILRQRERWFEVSLPGGRVGWVRRSAVVVL